METLSNNDTILTILKTKLGIMSNKRDEYLMKIIEGVQSELTSVHGLTFDYSRIEYQMFVVDYAAFRYESRGETGMPRHLKWRLHNLIISKG